MARTCWIAGLALCAVLGGGQHATAGTDQALTLKVAISDEVGVPVDTLRRARLQTSRIFDTVGIRLEWVDGFTPEGRCIVIRIGSKSFSRLSKNPKVLGVAAGTPNGVGIVAWLFYDRIQNLQHAIGIDTSIFLGHVMAHEMGHLLLPYGSHTPEGLMKASWDTRQALLAARSTLTFNSNQAMAIRTGLAQASDSRQR